jgi:hypothetical protein
VLIVGAKATPADTALAAQALAEQYDLQAIIEHVIEPLREKYAEGDEYVYEIRCGAMTKPAAAISCAWPLRLTIRSVPIALRPKRSSLVTTNTSPASNLSRSLAKALRSKAATEPETVSQTYCCNAGIFTNR